MELASVFASPFLGSAMLVSNIR